MSSLSAARADNYYYPKEWRPEHGSINAFHKSHPLGKRARHLDDGVLIVRFEMPFNVWCTHCDTHIGRGVRYNAKKRKVDMYYTTSIYEFCMPCAQCKGEMVIRTDPANRGYALVSGVRQKVEQFRSEDVETEQLNEPEVGQRLQDDPFFRLEHERQDKARAQKRSTGLQAILDTQEAQYKDDYASNAALRTKFRKEKRVIARKQKVLERLGLPMPIVEAEPDDRLRARAVVFKRSSRGSNTTSSAPADAFHCFGESKATSLLHRMKAAKASASRSSSKLKGHKSRKVQRSS